MPEELDRPITPHKAALIDWAMERFEIKSMVDLGGCWAVNGGYLLHAARGYGLERGVIVDGIMTQLTKERAKEFPQVELIAGALGAPKIVKKVGKVDAAIMYDILLHQVSPDWNEFLAAYAENVDTLIIFNQNWLGPETIRFVDAFPAEEYVKRVPHTNPAAVAEWYSRHEKRNRELKRPWRDIHYFWQWGITQKDLIGTLWDLGYRIDYLSSYGEYNPKFPEIELIGIIARKREGGRPASEPLPPIGST